MSYLLQWVLDIWELYGFNLFGIDICIARTFHSIVRGEKNFLPCHHHVLLALEVFQAARTSFRIEKLNESTCCKVGAKQMLLESVAGE